MEKGQGDINAVGIDYKELPQDVAPGDLLLLNDGLIQLTVESVEGHLVHTIVTVGGVLSNNKGINRLGGGLTAPAFTEKDKEDLITAAEIGVDYIAVSFPRSGDDMRYVVQEGYVRGRSLREGAQDSPDADPVIALMQTGWGDPNNGFMRGFASMIMPSASAEEINQMIHLIASVAKPEDVVMARRIIDKFTAEDCLSKVDIPCLVIHARNDPIHPVEEARELAMGIPDSELLIVESCHTVCTPSDPTWEEQVSAMMDFLAEA